MATIIETNHNLSGEELTLPTLLNPRILSMIDTVRKSIVPILETLNEYALTISRVVRETLQAINLKIVQVPYVKVFISEYIREIEYEAVNQTIDISEIDFGYTEESVEDYEVENTVPEVIKESSTEISNYDSSSKPFNMDIAKVFSIVFWITLIKTYFGGYVEHKKKELLKESYKIVDLAIRFVFFVLLLYIMSI